MKVILAVAVLLCLTAPAFAAPPALSLATAGPVYVAPVKGATPFVGALLTLKLPASWGSWTDYVRPAAVVRTAGFATRGSVSPAIALPVSINNAPAAYVGFTYVPGAEHACVFAGVDLMVLMQIGK